MSDRRRCFTSTFGADVKADASLKSRTGRASADRVQSALVLIVDVPATFELPSEALKLGGSGPSPYRALHVTVSPEKRQRAKYQPCPTQYVSSTSTSELESSSEAEVGAQG